MGGSADPMFDPTRPIVCDVLTGFLGSGKTTLLNRFLREGGAFGTAVIVNEVGAVGIDQLILSRVAENIALLESGCLCCSLVGALHETLLDLKRRAQEAGHPVERILIETTGLAEPAPILHVLLGSKSLSSEGFSLGRVIVTVDAQMAAGQIARQRETVRQVALADVLAITKTDLADAPGIVALHGALDGLNCVAPRFDVNAGSALSRIFVEPVPKFAAQMVTSVSGAIHEIDEGSAPNVASHRHHAHDAHVHGGVTSYSFWMDEGEVHPAGLAAWMHLLVNEYGDRILRCKGLFHLTEPQRDVHIQGVGSYFYAPAPLDTWPDEDRRARVVVIGEQLDEAWLQASLGALAIRESGLLPRNLQELCQVL